MAVGGHYSSLLLDMGLGPVFSRINRLLLGRGRPALVQLSLHLFGGRPGGLLVDGTSSAAVFTSLILQFSLSYMCVICSDCLKMENVVEFLEKSNISKESIQNISGEYNYL
jgi:hypothetical protein